MELTIEDFQKEIKLGLEKQLEEAEINRIRNKYHKEFMKMPFDRLKEIVSSYSLPERVASYFCKNTHIRYKVASMYLARQQK